MCTKYSKEVFWLLFAGCISLTFAISSDFFSVEEDALETCKKELGVNDEKVKEMIDAEEPNEDYSCFFGCVMHNDGVINEIGQFNKTAADTTLEAVDDENEKAAIKEFFQSLDESLSSVSDLCSAGKVFQGYLYAMKSAATKEK